MNQPRSVKVNLGCGGRYHPDWVNIDIAPQGPGVIQADISEGIPLPDSSCDVVYNAAVLEHMRTSDASRFIDDCFRILKPGGIIRVGIPDLERLCRAYLSTLDRALSGDKTAIADYDWIILELLDQAVREQSGGAMLEFLKQEPLPNPDFIFERIGEEGRELVESIKAQRGEPKAASRSSRGSLREGLSSFRAKTRAAAARVSGTQSDARALEIGRFRLAGEAHQWMYDRFSLGRLLTGAGFTDVEVKTAESSGIPDWKSYNLDVTAAGDVIKPDLLFMEGIKPASRNK